MFIRWGTTQLASVDDHSQLPSFFIVWGSNDVSVDKPAGLPAYIQTFMEVYATLETWRKQVCRPAHVYMQVYDDYEFRKANFHAFPPPFGLTLIQIKVREP